MHAFKLKIATVLAFVVTLLVSFIYSVNITVYFFSIFKVSTLCVIITNSFK